MLLLQGFWGRIQWLWDSSPVKRIRITMTMAQWSVRIPAIIALLATQGSLLASSVRASSSTGVCKDWRQAMAGLSHLACIPVGEALCTTRPACLFGSVHIQVTGE